MKISFTNMNIFSYTYDMKFFLFIYEFNNITLF